MIIGKGLGVKKYRILSEKLPPSFSGKRLVFLSDLHGKTYGEKNEKLLKWIERLAPHYILIGGDSVVGGVSKKGKPRKESEPSIQVSLDFIRKLANEFPVYYALGNHEEKLEKSLLKRYNEDLKKLGVVLLDNRKIKLISEKGEEIFLYGLSLGKKFYPKLKREKMKQEEIREKIGEVGEGFTILLAHSPLYFETYMEWGADLVLSGHLHGGIMRLPFLGGVIGPDFFLFPKYSGGRYQNEKGRMIVSCGLGTHTLHLRVFNPPEITVIDLECGEKKHGN